MSPARILAPECPRNSASTSLVNEFGLPVLITSLTIDKTMNSTDAMAMNKSIPNNIFSSIIF